MIQVAGWAYDAGLRDPIVLAKSVAIASAESGRVTDRLGDVGLQTAVWGPSVGLWQIRSLKADKGTGRTRDQDRLTDPAFNAKAMVEISRNGRDFGPWSVYSPRDLIGFARYQAALPPATTAVGIMLGQKGTGQLSDAAGDAVGDALAPITQLAGVVSDVAQTPGKVLNWLTDGSTWVRIAYFGAGFVLIVGGSLALAGRPVARTAAQVVTLVTPSGRIAKTVTAAAK